jgi:hypothetical protein
LDPQDWYWAALFQQLEVGTSLRWQTVGTGVDRVTNPSTAVRDTWVDLASNLPLGVHELIITAPEGTPPITELIAYDPAGSSTRTGSTVYLLAIREGVVLDSDSALETSLELTNESGIGGIDNVQPPFWLPSSNVTSQFFRAKPSGRRRQSSGSGGTDGPVEEFGERQLIARVRDGSWDLGELAERSAAWANLEGFLEGRLSRIDRFIFETLHSRPISNVPLPRSQAHPMIPLHGRSSAPSRPTCP